MLYPVVYGILPSHEEVNDILQDTFIKVHRSLPKLKNKQAFKSWVYRIAINTTYNRLKSKHRRELPSEPTDFLLQNIETPEQSQAQLEHEEMQKMVFKALDHLSPDHRAVVTLVELEEMSCAEAAEVLDCPAGTVRSRLHYAKKQLFKLLKPYRTYLSGEPS